MELAHPFTTLQEISKQCQCICLLVWVFAVLQTCKLLDSVGLVSLCTCTQQATGLQLPGTDGMNLHSKRVRTSLIRAEHGATDPFGNPPKDLHRTRCAKKVAPLWRTAAAASHRLRMPSAPLKGNLLDLRAPMQSSNNNQKQVQRHVLL